MAKRLSEFFAPTLREDPKDAESKSHKIMLRAGMIKQVSAGIYTFLPMGLRVLKKIEKVIRDQMDKIGCIEVMLPLVTPAELWKESGRWLSYGKELLRFKDRGNRDFCLAPTHEEIITDLIRTYVRSYKDLPISLFQIGQKFRDEARPRFGVIRAREFIMKDAYSFDPDEESSEKTYENFYKAYLEIFSKLEIEVAPVEAAVGQIGGKFSHEFIAPSPAGEDTMLECQNCGFITKKELAPCTKIPQAERKTQNYPKKVYTPATTTVASLAEYLKVPDSKIIKSLFLRTEKGYVLALVRGDYEFSEEKLRLLIGSFELAQEEEIRNIFGAGKGFIGPLNWNGRKISDWSVLSVGDGICGADEDDHHFINVVPGRDFQLGELVDIREAKSGDICPKCEKKTYKEIRGLEVGHTFYLGTKYSEPMKAYFTDKNGKEKPIVMGCYGIGVSRLISAVMEQKNALPPSCSPFIAEIIPVNTRDKTTMEASEKLFLELKDLEILFDDRNETAGVKFNDAELLGIPYLIIVGRRYKERREFELRDRLLGKTVYLSEDEVTRLFQNKKKI